jgi:1-phosphofructokinase
MARFGVESLRAPVYVSGLKSMPHPFRILTVTLNPAIDWTLELDHLDPGTVHRAKEGRREAGGKGVNVATLLAIAGHPVTATGVLGANNARIFDLHFDEYGIEDKFVRMEGETRTSVKIVATAKRMTTDINVPGFTVSATEIALLRSVLERLAGSFHWVAFSGSVPQGISVEAFRSLITAAQNHGACISVDTSGPALSAALEHGVKLIKPNAVEWAEAMKLDPADTEALCASVRQYAADTGKTAILTLGSRGALFAEDQAWVRAEAPEVPVFSTVGAGDAVLAGYLHGLSMGGDLSERARMATAFAALRLQSRSRDVRDSKLVSVAKFRVKVKAG